jgi:hypothetical protein
MLENNVPSFESYVAAHSVVRPFRILELWSLSKCPNCRADIESSRMRIYL